MSKYPYLIGIMFVLFITSCDEPSSFDFSEYRAGLMVNSWVHSWDGKCPGKLMVFEAFDGTREFNFWRLRNRLELFADSTATYTVATPIDPHLNDANNPVHGIWTYDSITNTLLILDPGGEIFYSFKVQAISEERLIMRYQEISPDGKDH